jgi:hypothetical protein
MLFCLPFGFGFIPLEPSEIDSRVDEHLTDESDSDINAALWLRILDEEPQTLSSHMSKPSKNQSRSIPSLFLFNIEEREL